MYLTSETQKTLFLRGGYDPFLDTQKGHWWNSASLNQNVVLWFEFLTLSVLGPSSDSLNEDYNVVLAECVIDSFTQSFYIYVPCQKLVRENDLL